MRKRRILGRPGSAYHVISRFVDRQFALGDTKAKRVFLGILKSQAGFAGVELLTYCLMGNHFHLLIRIPEAPELPEEVVLKRLQYIWTEKRLTAFREKLARFREISGEGETMVNEELDRQRRRMYNLSEFAKDVKQRFSIWFNQANGRKGTLFEERFKSVLVESGRALRMMAAYIDLNPVRAGLVTDPVDYPWSGYAAAVGGNEACRQGLRSVMTDPRDTRAEPWPNASRRYRLWLVDRGMETHHRDGRQKKVGFTRADAIAAWRSEGVVPPAKLIRCTVRYFTESVICGSREFIEEHIASHPAVHGKHPKAHAAGASCGDLCSLVNLHGPPVS